MHTRHASPHRNALLAARAAQMRALPTASERALFSALGSRQLGVAFRRQVVIGEYVADFVAPIARLVVEVDGSAHVGRQRADARRDRALAKLGYRVLRLDAELVVRALDVAVARIREALDRHGQGAPRSATSAKRPDIKSEPSAHT